MHCFVTMGGSEQVAFDTVHTVKNCIVPGAPPINHQSKIDAERRNVHHFTRLLRHEQFFFLGGGQ